MNKTHAWLFTLIGVLAVLPLLGMSTGMWGPWLTALSFLVIGITQLMKAH